MTTQVLPSDFIALKQPSRNGFGAYYRLAYGHDPKKAWGTLYPTYNGWTAVTTSDKFSHLVRKHLRPVKKGDIHSALKACRAAYMEFHPETDDEYDRWLTAA